MVSKPFRFGTTLFFALDTFEGVTGGIDFVENGDPKREAVILRFGNGKAHFVERIQPE